MPRKKHDPYTSEGIIEDFLSGVLETGVEDVDEDLLEFYEPHDEDEEYDPDEDWESEYGSAIDEHFVMKRVRELGSLPTSGDCPYCGASGTMHYSNEFYTCDACESAVYYEHYLQWYVGGHLDMDDEDIHKAKRKRRKNGY